MEATFPFGGRREVGFSAIIKQARARCKDRIKRNARPLQGDSSEKGDVEVGGLSGTEIRDIEGFYRKECTKRMPPISPMFQPSIELLRQHGLMVAIVHDENRPVREAACQPGSLHLPGRGGLCQSRVVLDVTGIGAAVPGKSALRLELTRWHQLPAMRTVIEVGQRIKKSRCRIVGDPFGIRIDDRMQKHRVGICRLETAGIEWRRKLIDEDALVEL